MKTNLSFSEALESLKLGKKIQRAGWNGYGMFAYLVPAGEYPAQTGVAKEYFGENNRVPYRAYLALKTAQGDVAHWSPSGSDLLENDWIVYDEGEFQNEKPEEDIVPEEEIVPE